MITNLMRAFAELANDDDLSQVGEHMLSVLPATVTDGDRALYDAVASACVDYATAEVDANYAADVVAVFNRHRNAAQVGTNAIKTFESLPAGATVQLNGISYEKLDWPVGRWLVDGVDAITTTARLGAVDVGIAVDDSTALVVELVPCTHCGRVLPVAADLADAPLGDDEVAYVRDPMAWELDGDDTPDWRCGACVVRRGDDI